MPPVCRSCCCGALGLNAPANLSFCGDPGTVTVNLTGINGGGGTPITISAASSNGALIPTPSVTYTSPNATGSIAFTPAAGMNGTVTIAVTVSSACGTLSRSFTVTVTPRGSLIVNSSSCFADATCPLVVTSTVSPTLGSQSFTSGVTSATYANSLIPGTTYTVTLTDTNSGGRLTYTSGVYTYPGGGFLFGGGNPVSFVAPGCNQSREVSFSGTPNAGYACFYGAVPWKTTLNFNDTINGAAGTATYNAVSSTWVGTGVTGNGTTLSYAFGPGYMAGSQCAVVYSAGPGVPGPFGGVFSSYTCFAGLTATFTRIGGGAGTIVVSE